MTPREVFDAMRPFYPDWPKDWTANPIIQSVCYAMARHPARLRAWLSLKEPVKPVSPALEELLYWKTSLYQSKRTSALPQLDRKRLAAGEKDTD